jgi:hypothetical protein
MTDEIKRYLIWRFNMNNHPKYKKYCTEWIDNLTENQILYFIEERKRLINRKIYDY